MRQKETIGGIAFAVVISLLASVGQAVGWSSHPVGERSHPKPIFVPSDKRCYEHADGTSRQSPDPLSPPCVPSFPGDNGGATYRGVSRDEIRIVLYNDLGVEGDLNQPWRPTDEEPGHESSQNGQATYLVRTIKALHHYFLGGFQTYGRRVHLIAVASRGGLTSTCAQRQVEAELLWRDYEPFAFVALGDGMECFADQAAARDIPTLGVLYDMSRDVYVDNAGMIFSFERDREELAQMSAGFVCDKLAREAARFSKGTLAASTRRFALLYPDALSDQRGPGRAQHAGNLLRSLERRCGLVQSLDGSSGLLVRAFHGGGQTEAVPLMAELRQLGVTTAICICVPVMPESTILHFQTAATAIGYHPEWYFDTASRMYRSDWHRRYTVPGHAAIGLTPEWYIPSFHEGFPAAAYASMEPGAPMNTRFAFDVYHGLHLLYTALQTAGPDLNPRNVDRGLATHQLHQRPGARLPIGSMSGDQPGNRYTFRRSALAWVWDPTGAESSDGARQGCLRSPLHAAIDGAWNEGDADLGAGACLGSHVVAGSTWPVRVPVALPLSI